MTANPSPLYSRLQEFAAPSSAIHDAEEEHAEEEHGGGSLFERVTAEQDSPIPKMPEVVTANLTALGITSDLAGSNLTDGYQLHTVNFSNFDKAGDTPGRMTETASNSSVQSVGADILPVLELDFSFDTAPVIAQRGTFGPTGAQHTST